jgi:hypothetical protein
MKKLFIICVVLALTLGACAYLGKRTEVEPHNNILFR